MIAELDTALSALLRRAVLDRAQVGVAFDTPTREWGARRAAPTLNAFLYDIREDLARAVPSVLAARPLAGTGPADGGLGRGTVPIGPIGQRSFRFTYLLTAWTRRPEDEHRVLGDVLAALVGCDKLPADLAPAGPAGPADVRITVGRPADDLTSTADLWSALGGELKPALHVALTAAIPTGQVPTATARTGAPATAASA